MELIIFLVIIIGVVYGWRDYKKKVKKAGDGGEVRNTFVPLFLLAFLVVLIVIVVFF